MHKLRVTRYYIPAGASFEPAIKRCLRDALEAGPVTIIRGDGVQVVLSATLQTVDVVRSSSSGDLYALQYEPGTPHTPAYIVRWTGPLTIAGAMEISDLQWIEHPMAARLPIDGFSDCIVITMPPATRTIEQTNGQPGPLNNIRRLE